MRVPRVVAAFSLIELLVVITISLLLLGGALTAFGQYSDRRAVLGAADELKTYFQTAATKATAGDVDGCTQLAGYQVQTYLVGALTNVSIQAVCSAGTATPPQVSQLPAGVTVTPNLDVVFQVLNAGVILADDAASQDILVSNGTYGYQFTLFREGRTSEGTWQ